MFFDRKDFSDQILIHLYRTILFPRLIEDKMLVLLRQGKISKWFSGIGQEAISAGVVSALEPDEWIMPLHRNLGIFTGRNMSLRKLFLQWQGSQEGYSKGRERSFHFGSREHYICGMISHLGPQLALADGTSLGYKLKKEKKLSAAFTGEGGTSEGDFHEALNLAAVWELPVIFIIENNGYGLSTPVKEQFRANRLADKGIGYGMESVQIDGNNILDVYDTIRGVREYCIREQKPYLVECMTFRMRGHEEASGTKYIPAELFEAWSKKDPVSNYESWLIETGILNEEKIKEIRNEFRSEIENAISVKENPVIPDTEKEIMDMYAKTPQFTDPLDWQLTDPVASPVKRFIDGIRDGLWQSMEKHANLILMGQDIAEYGGAFKITEGFLEKFGHERVRNTPLCESAVVGAALGLTLEGFKSVMEMQFADFAAVGFNQIVNNLAKIHYRWGQNADVVIRMPTGAGVGAGPFHSQSNEAWFTHIPGLKVVYPSSPADAKGLLNAAIMDPNPVLFFEHKVLYRSISGPLPEPYYYTEIGKANLVRIGDDISIITYGAGVHWAQGLAQDKPDISFHILDLRTLLPLDYEAIREAVAKTGKVILLHEDTLTGGIGGEISAWIGQHCFELLDAPVMRCASLDTAIPFNIELEKNFLANARLWETVERLLSY
ncbi:MAG TPA: dehydrogenase E1 component subunit alpha/beta [Puia sp.]|nr:dehydrogenase E1 component subunit alpha/beta [Puia sp.]